MPKGDKLRVLTEEQAKAIHEDRRTYSEIAIEYGVSSMTVSNIKTGKTWKHLKMQPTKRGKTWKRMPKTDEAADAYVKSYATMITSQTDFIEAKVLVERGI